MKKYFVLVVALYLTMGVYAQTQLQEKSQAPTKIESIFLSRGNIIIKEFIPLGTIGNASFEAVILTDPNNANMKVSGIKIEVSDNSRSIKNSNTAFLDLDEIESTIKSLVYMVDLAEKWKSEEKRVTEVAYSTKGYFSIGFNQDWTTQRAFISCGSVGKATSIIEIKDLNMAKAMIEKGLSQIK